MLPVGDADVYLVPRPPGVDVGLTIDLRALGAHRQRLTEIATVNKYRAPELQTALNRAWLQTRNYVAQLKSTRLCAERAEREARARAIIAAEESPPDIRKAKADLDPDVQKYAKMSAEIRLVEDLLTDEAVSFRDAVHAVRAIAGLGQPAPNIPVVDVSESHPLPVAPAPAGTASSIFGPPSHER